MAAVCTGQKYMRFPAIRTRRLPLLWIASLEGWEFCLSPVATVKDELPFFAHVLVTRLVYEDSRHREGMDLRTTAIELCSTGWLPHERLRQGKS